MHPIRWGILLGLGIWLGWTSALAAPVPKQRRKDYQELIQGRWRVIAREYNGGQRSGREDCFWTYSAEKMVITNGPNDRGGSTFTYKIDASQAPMHLDLFLNGSHYQGLFELDGDTMKWANTGPGGVRPKEVSSANNVNLILFARE